MDCGRNPRLKIIQKRLQECVSSNIKSHLCMCWLTHEQLDGGQNRVKQRFSYVFDFDVNFENSHTNACTHFNPLHNGNVNTKLVNLFGWHIRCEIQIDASMKWVVWRMRRWSLFFVHVPLALACVCYICTHGMLFDCGFQLTYSSGCNQLQCDIFIDRQIKIIPTETRTKGVEDNKYYASSSSCNLRFEMTLRALRLKAQWRQKPVKKEEGGE